MRQVGDQNLISSQQYYFLGSHRQESSLKKSLFPVHRVVEIMDTGAAANSFFLFLFYSFFFF